MRKIVIERTVNSPRVILDPGNNQYEISGESRPPNALAFYEEILSWADEFSDWLPGSPQVSNPVQINLDFDYFNSSSAKYLLDFCKKMARLHTGVNNITIRWHYDAEDTDMLEVGQEMSKLAKLPFEFKQRASS
ncbi:MAG: DUF1987 domain-containing protein [Bacteroidota bacterium]|jgi:hypothetical protein|nr:DUF1987 domain-containing protein [Bacteroidota bacterium]